MVGGENIMRSLEILTLTIFTILGMFAIVTSIPMGSPHIYAYCLLSQIGTVPVDGDAFRIFCLKEPTDSPSGVDDPPDKRVHTLYEYDNYDRILPQSYGRANQVEQHPNE